MGLYCVSLYLLVLIGTLVQNGVAQFDCDPINVTISTNITTKDGSYMAYAGKPLNVRCDFTCNNCVKNYVYWRKEQTEIMYRLDWSAGDRGPGPGYENTVKLVEEDNATGIYVMEWNVPPGQHDTTLDCNTKTNICVSKNDQTDVILYKFPELFVYADGDLVVDVEDLKGKTRGTANCTVISNPGSRILMVQGDVVLANNSSCSPFSQNEFICSVEVPDEVDFTEGFGCNVTYNSPETGSYEKVIPDGPSPEGLYPQTSKTLEGWEIGLIVIGCLAAVGLLVGGVIYYKKHQDDGKKKAGGGNKTDKSVGKGVASKPAEDQQSATANQSAPSTTQSSPSPSQRSQTRSANDESKQRRPGESKSSDK